MNYKKGQQDFAAACGISPEKAEGLYEIIEKALQGPESIDDIVASMAPHINTAEESCFMCLTAIAVINGIAGEL